MSTHAIISVKVGDMLHAVYCHNDGYRYRAGRCLLENYNTQEAAEHLVALGDLASVGPRLAPEAGEPHSFDHPAQGVTVAYHRDRGEVFNAYSFQLSGPTWDEVGAVLNRFDTEYIYVFLGGSWHYIKGHEFVALTRKNTRTPRENKEANAALKKKARVCLMNNHDTPVKTFKITPMEDINPDKMTSDYISMAAELRYHKSKLAEAEQALELEIKKRRRAEEKLEDAEEDLATMQNRLVRMFTAPSDPNGLRGMTKEFWFEILKDAQEAGLCVVPPDFGEAYRRACELERGR